MKFYKYKNDDDYAYVEDKGIWYVNIVNVMVPLLLNRKDEINE